MSYRVEKLVQCFIAGQRSHGRRSKKEIHFNKMSIEFAEQANMRRQGSGHGGSVPVEAVDLDSLKRCASTASAQPWGRAKDWSGNWQGMAEAMRPRCDLSMPGVASRSVST